MKHCARICLGLTLFQLGCGLVREPRFVVRRERDAAALSDSSLEDDVSDASDGGVISSDASDGGVIVVEAGVACVGPMRCYTGAVGTESVGRCQVGTQLCESGTLSSTCLNQVLPSPEVCNGLDDDCDGSVDEGLAIPSCGVGACRRTPTSCTQACVPGVPMVSDSCGAAPADLNCNGVVGDGCACVYVSSDATATDASACGSSALPCRTINWAINRAAMTPGRSVCVMGPSGCGTGMPISRLMPFSESVIMRNGVHVIGGYDGALRYGTLCEAVIEPPRAATAAFAVAFPASVSDPTLLSGLTLRGPTRDGTPGTVSVGLFIEGRGARVSDNVISAGRAALSTGVKVATGSNDAAGVPLLLRNRIEAAAGGNAADVSTGLFVERSAIEVDSSCRSLDTQGRCSQPCGPSGPEIRGVQLGLMGDGSVSAVRLVNASNTRISRSAICGVSTGSSAEAIGVHIAGNSAGIVIEKSNIGAASRSEASGVFLDDCQSTSERGPFLVDNPRISAGTLGTGESYGVRSQGPNCHTRIARNTAIFGNEYGLQGSAIGIQCRQASPCVIANNGLIAGSVAGTLLSATGVDCVDPGSCASIEGNGVVDPAMRESGILGGHANASIGLRLLNASPRVRRNVITSGQGIVSGHGVELLSSAATLESNVVIARSSLPLTGAAPADLAGVFVAGSGAGEWVFQSNSVDVVQAAACVSSSAVSLGARLGHTNPLAPRGVLHNNILSVTSVCRDGVVVREEATRHDPRVVQNNDLVAIGLGVSLYRDGASRSLTLAEINALGALFSGNFAMAPGFATGTYRLTPSSPCIDTGILDTATQDFDGRARPFYVRQLPGFDVGAFEFRP
ncbi:MAG: choice-of-anchor Q domain-containing protein [Deltaproteobacteria bacterium]|nr:choice-of-anchor Q domain-containing protein [Deltaproteobacteria bacterium]